ncbi:inovirus Gp2 family protein [Burkholderia pseudomallei]|uniref:inovirus Gp2 family protein n=1 Tax=Burkholderia pseudomallei TaxID=28450 RepID=UPI0021F7CD1C|nr:inovirus Gp2 family protein [Burkholderia pseudomallei]MCW0090577.1 inovirus Gp2 family protein [Burkholderia pseudomallei]MCW0122560.1 inovirus Gp2 family protein [Burkholderia pseudomallei]MDK2567920.1 inovirus Gp2 family protein [Burkholderia pseudomallei]MDK2576102.1 inovirus Gp2 family protein [Burkholderia pseudomallei]
MDANTLHEETLDLDESLFELKYEDVDDRMETIHRFVDETNTVSSEERKTLVVGKSLKLLASLIRFVNKDVLNGKQPAYLIKATKNGAVISESKLAHWIKLLPAFARLYNHQFGYSPDLRLFFECYRSHRISRLMTEPAEGELERAEIANDFISTLRGEAKRTKLAYRLRQWMRNSTENRKKIRRYLRALFLIHARLVVVRIDLHLSKEGMLSNGLADDIYQRIVEQCEGSYRLYMNGVDLDEGFDADAMKSFQLMATERETFLNAIRRKYCADQVGYVWSMEFSASGHYHIHMCMFFNGSTVDGKRHSWLAQELCDLWKKTTQRPGGYAFNCNRMKYDKPACGIVEYHDGEKIGYLIKTLDYLAKNSQLVRLKSAKGKTFNTGAMPEVRPSRLAGRPRSKALATIDDEL